MGPRAKVLFSHVHLIHLWFPVVRGITVHLSLGICTKGAQNNWSLRSILGLHVEFKPPHVVCSFLWVPRVVMAAHPSILWSLSQQPLGERQDWWPALHRKCTRVLKLDGENRDQCVVSWEATTAWLHFLEEERKQQIGFWCYMAWKQGATYLPFIFFLQSPGGRRTMCSSSSETTSNNTSRFLILFS